MTHEHTPFVVVVSPSRLVLLLPGPDATRTLQQIRHRVAESASICVLALSENDATDDQKL
jgi:hypothetical protein